MQGKRLTEYGHARIPLFGKAADKNPFFPSPRASGQRVRARGASSVPPLPAPLLHKHVEEREI